MPKNQLTGEVLKVIRSLAELHMTMVIVTHEMQFARAIADRVIFLDNGHIVEDAKPEEFFTHPATQRAKDFLQTFAYEKRRSNTNNNNFTVTNGSF